ncbi:type II toxin-antitoxin system HicA family toxin [Chromobacterium rhizoryzae]|uniref:Type II toxin-antitoxin system HicA family toxin n=1 Tax=Chromobacterium rhizoryzae TaxID=1778675 RepID=A0AAD0W9S2_9NEIS|nr:type II toxin-antitoxin system HicA family toxin [Chromobacterium rhizoryzae]AXT47756.1 type II toxin-antitoxin system HicA family toxin [Chromobacterium rhizoryzae]
MSKVDKALAKLRGNPRPKDFTWDDLILVMESHNFTYHKGGSGSGRKFLHPSGYPLCLHEPHPEPTLKAYAIKAAIQALIETGEIQ